MRAQYWECEVLKMGGWTNQRPGSGPEVWDLSPGRVEPSLWWGCQHSHLARANQDNIRGADTDWGKYCHDLMCESCDVLICLHFLLLYFGFWILQLCTLLNTSQSGKNAGDLRSNHHQAEIYEIKNKNKVLEIEHYLFLGCVRCFEGGVSRAWRAAKLPGQRWYPDIHHQISHPHSGQAHCITSLDPKLSIAEIFVRNILHRNWSSPLTMSKLLPGVNDRDILWCPHLMHTVAVTAGSRGRGGAIIPARAGARARAAHTFYILRVRDGEERKQGGWHE